MSPVEQLEQQSIAIITTPTRWDDIYHRLCCSDFRDDRWSATNFCHQRVKDAVKALEWLEKHDMATVNANSISTAKLSGVVIGALGGKNAKVSIDDFLPFDTRKIKKENGINEESYGVLSRLMKTRKMDGRLVALLSDELKNSPENRRS